MGRRRVDIVRKVRRSRAVSAGGRRGGGFGGGGRVLQPGELPYRPNVWHRVGSSWIKALRYVPTGIATAKHIVGYVDMWVYWKGRKYRYGERRPVYAERFGDWIEAASKGKFWWYRWTREYSPARRIG